LRHAQDLADRLGDVTRQRHLDEDERFVDE